MKKDYEKPIVEVFIFEYDIVAAGSGPGGDGEGEQDVGDWFPDK